MNKIKRCPFCGDDAELSGKWLDKFERFVINVKCVTCNAQSGSSYAEDNERSLDKAASQAVRRWNKRVEEE